MNNKFLTLIGIMIVALLIAGCESEPVVDNTETIAATTTATAITNTESSGNIVESLETITDAIESGKPVKCTIEYSNEDIEESINIIYWIMGNNMKMETTVDDVSQIAIQKDKVMYMEAKNTGIETDCKWVTTDLADNLESSDYEENADFDYTQYEDDSTFNINCNPESFGNEKFEVSGKVCSMEELMGGMMEGFNLE